MLRLGVVTVPPQSGNAMGGVIPQVSEWNQVPYLGCLLLSKERRGFHCQPATAEDLRNQAWRPRMGSPLNLYESQKFHRTTTWPLCWTCVVSYEHVEWTSELLSHDLLLLRVRTFW